LVYRRKIFLGDHPIRFGLHKGKTRRDRNDAVLGGVGHNKLPTFGWDNAPAGDCSGQIVSEIVDTFRAYAEETNRLNWERRASGDADRRELDKIARSIKEIVATIEEGSGSRALVTRLRELEAQEDELKARLAQAPVDIPDIHPNVGGVYRRKVERLAEALRNPEERDEAADAIRTLIEKITLTPDPKRGELAATLHGDLGTILEWTAQRANSNGRDDSRVSVSVVAGAQNHRQLTLCCSVWAGPNHGQETNFGELLSSPLPSALRHSPRSAFFINRTCPELRHLWSPDRLGA
jgi:hypothetical protein